ncbi:MAG TPA: hypothetical protein VGJ94_04570, partial [Syntrophorhabdaceae bacterium]
PGLVEAHNNLIYVHQFLPDISLEEILDDHGKWNLVHALSLRGFERPFENSREPGRTLTLGFVSPDFRSHPVAFFIISVLEALARENCRIICYANQKKSDPMTERFKALSSRWRDVAALSDDDVHGLIMNDRIDILFDLTGFMENNRLLLFARKPAPLQVTWAGYMATTGLTAMDYIIADRHEIPEGSERFYTERVIRMNDSFVCYEPPPYAPPVSGLPALTRHYVTFGCFNLLCKISEQVIDVWAEILTRLPGSRLLLKTKELSCKSTGERYLSLFSQRGIDSGRIELLGRTPHREHMESYGRVDIALDTFPFSGSTTTLESLWMGVPVVTLPHETFAGRHSLSFLSTAGLPEMAAADKAGYVQIALDLAGDLPRLAAMRSSLRQRFASSPLCDGNTFARYLMKELRIIWSEWCKA